MFQKVEKEVKADRGLTISRMVELGRVSGSASASDDMELRDAMQRTALEMPAYGRRPITADFALAANR